LARTYGIDRDFEGPVYQSMAIEGLGIRLNFKPGSGLVASGGGELRGFVIAGADGKFVPAQARLDGNSVVVSNPEVAAPIAVRYAWASNPKGCNLVGSAGLPAAPFRTDSTSPKP
jgi:sialate O-acetylesterase